MIEVRSTGTPGVFELRLDMAALCKVDAAPSVALAVPVLQWGEITVHRHSRQITVAGTAVRLTSSEYIAIQLMVLAQGQTVLRDEMSRAALGRPVHGGEDRSVDQLMHNARSKIARHCGAQFGKDAVIGSHRGVGYFLRGSV